MRKVIIPMTVRSYYAAKGIVSLLDGNDALIIGVFWGRGSERGCSGINSF